MLDQENTTGMTLKASCADKVNPKRSGSSDVAYCITEFICQHPRWDSHIKLQPCSVYMSFQKEAAITTYIVVSGVEDECVKISRKRLEEACDVPKSTGRTFNMIDPYLFHHIIAQESFLQSKPIITKLRHRLYDALDNVDAYGKGDKSLDRIALRALTNELHLISQDADSLVSSSEMGTMVVEQMHTAHGHLAIIFDVQLKQRFARVDDSLAHLVQTLQARRRWLLSYKSRKDIAMNLVSKRICCCFINISVADENFAQGLQFGDPARQRNQYVDCSGHKKRQCSDENDCSSYNDLLTSDGGLKLLRHGVFQWTRWRADGNP